MVEILAPSGWSEMVMPNPSPLRPVAEVARDIAQGHFGQRAY